MTVAELTQSSLQDSTQTAQGENTSSLSLPYQPQVGVERQLGRAAHLHLPSSSRDQPGASLVLDPLQAPDGVTRANRFSLPHRLVARGHLPSL